MALAITKKLTATENARLSEIELTRLRWKAKNPATLIRAIVQFRIDAITNAWSEARATHIDIIVRDDYAETPDIVDIVFAVFQALFKDLLDESLRLFNSFDTKPAAEVHPPRAIPEDLAKRETPNTGHSHVLRFLRGLGRVS